MTTSFLFIILYYSQVSQLSTSAPVDLWCENFDSLGKWTFSGTYGGGTGSTVCSGGAGCVKLGENSEMYSDPLDVSGYSSIYVEYDVDTSEYELSDTLYVESSINYGSWVIIQTVTDSGTLINQIADFPPNADDSNNIRVQFRTFTSSTGDDVWIDNLCIYGTLGTRQPVHAPTFNPTSIPTGVPTTSIPTAIPSQIPIINPTSIPTATPSFNPSKSPTKTPSFNPSLFPTKTPTKFSTKTTTLNPSKSPTETPAEIPTDEAPIDDTVSTTSTEVIMDDEPGNDTSSFWNIMAPILVIFILCLCVIVAGIVYKFRKERLRLRHSEHKAVPKLMTHAVVALSKVNTHSVFSNESIQDINSAAPVDINTNDDQLLIDKDNDVPHRMTAGTIPIGNSIANDEFIIEDDNDNIVPHRMTVGTIGNSVPNDEFIIGDIGPQRITVGSNDALEDWFSNKVRLPEYYELFIQNGYNTLVSLQSIQSKQELYDIGVELKGHQTKIWVEIKRLKKTKNNPDNDKRRQTKGWANNDDIDDIDNIDNSDDMENEGTTSNDDISDTPTEPTDEGDVNDDVDLVDAVNNVHDVTGGQNINDYEIGTAQ